MFKYSNRYSDLKTGFNRHFTNDEIQQKAKLSLFPGRYSILDLRKDSIVLKTIVPSELLMLSYDLKKQSKKTLFRLNNNKELGGRNSLKFFENDLIFINAISSTLYKIDRKANISKVKKLDTIPFLNSEILNQNAFVLTGRTDIQGNSRRIFKKVDSNGFSTNSYMPSMQKEGFFSNDGQLLYDSKNKQVIYMYFYRGEFICLDSNLNTIYTSKTIDTITTSKLEIKQTDIMTKEGLIKKSTFAKPPFIVNGRFSLDNNLIYIQSYIKANNESSSKFNSSIVIDVYDIRNGKYKISFYLPKLDKQKLTYFKIHNSKIVALYNNTLATFELPKI